MGFRAFPGYPGPCLCTPDPLCEHPKLKRLVDWFFRDRRSGRIVIGQWPNLPLWLFGVTGLVAMLATGSIALWSDIASRIVLAWWAGDELLRGVNPWRRCLGAGVLVLLAIRLAA